jgi:hypothetical protein
MELRHRHLADAPAAPGAGRPPDDREPHPVDSRGADRPAADAGPARGDAPHYEADHYEPDRNEADRYDADAEFKHGIPKPPGYLPDDTGRLSPRSGAARSSELHHDERTPAEMPGRDIDRADTPRAYVDRPDLNDSFDRYSPDRYGDPLTRADGSRITCFRGPPSREQTRQGWAGDCGLIAALGSVAAHRPDDITDRVRLEPDGTYGVSLSEARQTDCGAAPTGRSIELSVTRHMPVYDEDPATPACAKAQGGTAWCPVIEKAFAGVDQTWTTERRVTWLDSWASLCAQDQADKVENPRSGPAPLGYIRLHQGTTPWERAEILTQLTGQESVVRQFPADPEEWRINRVIRTQLENGKPVLVSSRSQSYGDETLPHDLEPEHVYEVTGVERGKIVLRNPWNRDHPEPMETDEFVRDIRPWYTTLK